MRFTCIPRSPFAAIVREVTRRYGEQYRFQSVALDILQEATEHCLIQMFGDAVLLAEHGRRVTVMDRDMWLLLRLQRPRWRW